MVTSLSKKYATNVTQQLPTLSTQLSKILDALNNDSTNLHTLSERIRLDPVLTSRMLKVANSPFFGMERKISSIEEAVTVVGLSNTRALVMAVMVIEQFRHPAFEKFDLSSFWKHALSCAASAQEIAEETMVSPMLAFTTGLMHDLGRLLIMMQYPKEHEKIQEQQLITKRPLFEIEKEILGVDHAHMGADLLDQWRLPKEIVQAVASHHDRTVRSDELAGVIILADSFGAAIQTGELSRLDTLCQPWLEHFDITQPQLMSWVDPVKRRYETLCEMVV